MNFPISGVHIDPVYLIAVGFVVGMLGGFFGVGGSFLVGPALFAVGMPMNFVVGTDLAHIVGKSIVAARKHRTLGNIDMKLGMLMVVGTISGVEGGAQLIQWLKRSSHIDAVVGITFVIILVGISTFMTWEGIQTLRSHGKGRRSTRKGSSEHPSKRDHSSAAFIARAVHKISIPPHISLPVSGIPRISIWAVMIVAFLGGFFSGFLGGGAGYIRMPCLIFLLGIPTHIAVGTDLFEIIISASYGTVTHSLKGNVDILIALVMHTGAAIGAQIGATLTQHFGGPKIRLAFVPLPLLGALIMIHGLLVGHGAH
jgi:uncharacterized membrane protein YfcA